MAIAEAGTGVEEVLVAGPYGLGVRLHNSRTGIEGGAGSREAGTGVLGDRFQTRETGTMVWLTGVLLSVVNNCLVTWISGWVAGLYALLLGTLQCPFDLHLAMASPWYPQFYQTSVSQREQLYMC